MPRFSVQLEKDIQYGNRIQTLPRDLVLAPQHWSANDRGGCEQASIEAIGSAESLASLCGWLGDKVEIFNEFGECVWWGDLWDIELNLGNISIHMSLDEVRNRVKVTYPSILPDGSEQSNETGWAQDNDSVARYGKREIIYGSTRGNANIAAYMQATILKRMKLPQPNVTTSDQSSYSATLTAQGTWYKADALYFENLDGLEEHGDESGVQVLGVYMTSNQIGFGIWNPADHSEGAIESDEMQIYGGGDFLPLKRDDTFTVSGAVEELEGTTNNGTYTVENMDHPYQLGVGDDLIPEAPGPTIRISFGEQIAADNIATKFWLDTPWTVTRVGFIGRKIGEPTDLLRVEINADTLGVPGTMLTAVDISGASLFTELNWTEAPVTPVELAANTPYWLHIHRLGAANIDDGYEIAVDEEQGYTKFETPGSPLFNVLLATGGGWVARSPVCDMPFRIIGEIKSSEQLRKAIAGVESYYNTIIHVDSGIMVRQFDDRQMTVMDVIDELLEMGTSAGDRMIAYVTRDRSVVVDLAPLSSEEDYVLGMDGRLRHPNGSNILPGKLVYGQSVGIDSILLLDGLGIRQTRGAAVYIRASSYSAESDRLTVQSEGSPDPFSALKIVKG